MNMLSVCQPHVGVFALVLLQTGEPTTAHANEYVGAIFKS